MKLTRERLRRGRASSFSATLRIESAAPRSVVPLTDAAGNSESTIKPSFGAGIGGLTKRRLALCHQVRSIDRLRLRKLGSLDGRSMTMIERGLIAILDLPDAS